MCKFFFQGNTRILRDQKNSVIGSVVRYLNRSDDNDTVSGIAILDTTAIPEMRYAISMFFINRQSHTLVITEMCVSSSVSTVCKPTLTRL